MYIQIPGRRVCLAAVLSLILFACNHADRPAGTPVTRRMALIAALKELRGRILSGDKEQIGRIFDFPVPDSVFHPYFSNDSLLNAQFQAQMEKNGGVITQEMFNSHFDKIGGPAELEGFKDFFSFINPDDLLHRDSIDMDTALINDHASRIYWIHILGDSLVDISYGTGHCLPGNQEAAATPGTGAVKDTVQTRTDTTGAKSSVESGDDAEEDDPSSCEHTASWEFVFDGKKLRLLHQGAAD